MKKDPNSALAMRQEGVRADSKSVSLAKLLLKSKMVLFPFHTAHSVATLPPLLERRMLRCPKVPA